MAAQTPQEQIQPLAVTRRMLGTAETEPLACAFALTKDRKDCVLLIAKTGNGRKAAGTLKADGKDFVDAGTIRFGQVNIDVPNDPGTVRFTVNKSEAGGTILHMSKLVKKAGYQGLVINADSTLENQAEGSADGQPADAILPDTAPPDAPPPNLAPPPPPPPPGADPAALKRTLDAITPKLGAIAGGDAAQLQKLQQTAATAAAALEKGDVAAAAASIKELREAATAAATRTTATTNKPAGAQVALTQAMLLWGKTRDHLETQLRALEQAIIEQSTEESDFDQIKAAAPAVSEVLAVLDQRLEAKLKQVQDTQDVAERDKLRQQAKAIVGEYQTYIAGDPLMGALDGNPFIPFDGASRVNTTLTAIMKTL